MFSAISNYIWGANETADPPKQHPEVDDLTAMEISSIVSSDDEVQNTTNGPLSDEEGEWILIAGRKTANRKALSPPRKPKFTGIAPRVSEKSKYPRIFDLDMSAEEIKSIDEEEERRRRQLGDEFVRKMEELRAREAAQNNAEIESFLKRSHVPRPAVQRVILSEEIVQRTEKKQEEEDEDLLQQKVDRQKELSLLMEELRPAQKGKRLEEHSKLSRKALTKSNAVRDVASAGNGRLRRSDRLNPTMSARSNNNRKQF